MIPRLLHQIWCASPGPATPPADVYRPEWVESWRTHHPGWAYKLWDDQALRELADAQTLRALDAAAQHPVVRADIGRYLVLAKLGGLYADLDYECFRPFDALLSGQQAAIGEIGMRRGEKSSGRMGNALLAFAPEHPLAVALLEEACKRWLGGLRHVSKSTGPAMLAEVVQRFSDAIVFGAGTGEGTVPLVRILPSSLVMPTPVMTREDPTARASGAYATTYHAGWWRSGGACYRPVT